MYSMPDSVSVAVAIAGRHRPPTAAVRNDGCDREGARENGGVQPVPAEDGVIAATAGELVGAGIAGEVSAALPPMTFWM